MDRLNSLRKGYERTLEWLVIVLMVVLAAEVSLGILFRGLGRSLVWYDEVASILLAWLTFYGSALAALKRAHIGFPGLVNSLMPAWRVPVVCAPGAENVAPWLAGRPEKSSTSELIASPSGSDAVTVSVRVESSTTCTGVATVTTGARSTFAT